MLDQLQQQMEVVKQQLAQTEVQGTAADGMVTVTVTASKKIVNVSINPELMGKDNVEELEDLLVVAMDKAIQAAEQKSSEEISKVTAAFLPPGMDLSGFGF